ncbi:TAXI family TRAP transporter solute-binding subunit [Oscillatoria sp. FACHB-1407]|uniref:TAXI family TRAP transporter solute-binding subunit n=1 Tax=Oscillatoria sp. FACHB-1407 TaxID=2692847 RepID=UPI001687B1A0|nr:TAXI family TRAP transporter solute-binding subunit [Oscillatoria sp. FACHB-1407]MBD2464729.1 TAXI family TRAP transporter solute-binding subunit [Oscillatoria sp. FACHB-1407]
MQSKVTLPVVLLSVIAAIAFGGLWWRESRHVYQLTIATGSKEGEYHAFAQALATVVTRHHPRIQITVIESEGASQNMEWLEQQQVQLAIVQSDTPTQPSTRAVAYLFPEVFHLMANANSGIQTVNDLRGKRVALMPRGSGSYALFQSLSQHYQLQESDFTPVILSPREAYAALGRGEVDALFRVIALGNPATGDVLRSSRATLIPIDQVASLQLSLPYLEPMLIPKGTYDGGVPIPPNDVAVVGVRAVLVSHEDVNSEVIQAIAQTLFEFRNEIVSLYPRAATIRLPDAGENLGLPLHQGAKAYYDQDQPGFLVEYAELIGLFISVAIVLVSGFWQFHLWLSGRQKNRADMYNLEILEVIDQVQYMTDLHQLEAARHRLFDILCKVVVDLDKDRISAESFQSFTFPWEVAIATIRHREMVLRSEKSASLNN